MTLSDNIAVMSRGRLEQFGSPFEIYHQPATEFVASFVGKPRMNFFTAVHQERGRYALPGTAFTVHVGDLVLDQLRVGVRAEECDLRSPEKGEAEHAVVRAVEPLGNVSDVLRAVGDQQFMVRVSGFGTHSVGEPIVADTSRARIHCFDPDTGIRVN
jgi:ABC-type sugar transport system ATPase subunit